MVKTSQEILSRVDSYKNYVYWYGGKRSRCTAALAVALKKQNPDVWTNEYYAKAMDDVAHNRMCCDCSGLVCGAYGIQDIGTAQFLPRFKVWGGIPKAGMIAWKKGHTGIFLLDGWDSPIAEMRGIDYDFQNNRTFKQAGFTAVLYDSRVSYSNINSRAHEEVGWHKDAGGWWYRHTRGTGEETYFHDTIQVINNHVYAFNSYGALVFPSAAHPFDSWIVVDPNSTSGWLS